MALYANSNWRNRMSILITLMIGLVASILGFAIVAVTKTMGNMVIDIFKTNASKKSRI